MTVAYDPSEPHWKVAQKIQQAQTEYLLGTAEYNVLQPPCLPFWGEIADCHQLQLRSFQQPTLRHKRADEVAVALTANELLFRSFALHDLNRVAQCSALRRQTIFAKHWGEVVFALTTVIDAAALQVSSELLLNVSAPNLIDSCTSWTPS